MRRANGKGSIFKLSGKRRKPWAVMDQMRPHTRSVFKNAMGKVYAYAIKFVIIFIRNNN